MLGSIYLLGFYMIKTNDSAIIILSVAFFIGFGLELFFEGYARKHNVSGTVDEMILKVDERERKQHGKKKK
jgi:hypothetical protein